MAQGLDIRRNPSNTFNTPSGRASKEKEREREKEEGNLASSVQEV